MHTVMRSIDIFLWVADYRDDKNATNIDQKSSSIKWRQSSALVI